VESGALVMEWFAHGTDATFARAKSTEIFRCLRHNILAQFNYHATRCEINTEDSTGWHGNGLNLGQNPLTILLANGNVQVNQRIGSFHCPEQLAFVHVRPVGRALSYVTYHCPPTRPGWSKLSPDY